VSKRRQEPPPPFVARETERAILGASILWDGHARQFLDEGVREHHFWNRHHALVWRRMSELLKEGIDPPGMAHLMARLTKHRELEDVGIGYLTALADGVPRLTGPSMQGFVHELVEHYVGRQTIAALQQAHARLLKTPASLTEGFFTEMGASLTSMAAQLGGRRLPGHVTHIGDVMAEVIAALQAGPQDFIDTPWPALNGMLGGGLAPGELLFLGARPGIGKTAAALEIARKAGRGGHSVFVVSREMLRVAIGMRMLSQTGELDATRLRKRDLTEYHWHKIDAAVEQLAALPIFITHDSIDIDEIRRLVGVLADEAPLGLVIVDYLQLIDAPAGIQERRLQVEAVSKRLKGITLDFGVPVLCLSSLSRPADGKAPTLASLRESGNLEHDADTVILLHRPEELDPRTQCIVAKSRNGRTGMVELHFRGEFLRFEERYAEAG
jgi:replicative DNA helicase